VSRKKQWIVRASAWDIASSETVHQIAEELHLTPPTAQLLVNRGCDTPGKAADFLGKKTELFHDPFDLKDMAQAAETVLSAVEQGHKIAIYGDYDVDGVTSVSALYLYLKSLNADVTYYIPCRMGEGYGMSEKAVRKLAADGIQTIITVDTGITAVREAALTKELGITLVITDHHECCGELPDAAAAVNPHRPDDTYPFKELAGVGVVFKLLCAVECLRSPDDPMGECVRRICMEYIDLVAIGTVADVMPLCDENRLIVALGLRMIENSPREGIRALLEASMNESKSTQKKKITSSLIGFTIAPRINAAGRIQDASTAVQLFLEQEEEPARQLAHRLCDINRQRQNEENKIADAAYARIDAGIDIDENPVIVLEDDQWHHGVVGIVASRITERYGCPSILISFAPQNGGGEEENDLPAESFGKGSGRSVRGMNLVDALSACSDLLEKYGGHELAAGLTVRRENLPEFKKRINEYGRNCFAQGVPDPAIEVDCELTPRDFTMLQAEQLYALEPYGVSNPTPVFVSYFMKVEDISPVGAGKHLRIRLSGDGVSVTAMYFRHGLADVDFYPGDCVDVLYNLDINEFQNNRTLQFIVKDIRLAEEIQKKEDEELQQYREISDAMLENRPISPKDIPHVVPSREDCASVYTTLKHELSLGHEIYSIRALRHLLRTKNISIGYTKLTFILGIFGELNILQVEELDGERDIYRFRMVYGRGKANLDDSLLLRRLRCCAGML